MFVAVPPFSPASAFVSLWRFGYQQEIGGPILSEVSHINTHIAEVTRDHAMWGLSKVFASSGGCSVPNAEVEEDVHWKVA